MTPVQNKSAIANPWKTITQVFAKSPEYQRAWSELHREGLKKVGDRHDSKDYQQWHPNLNRDPLATYHMFLQIAGNESAPAHHRRFATDASQHYAEQLVRDVHSNRRIPLTLGTLANLPEKLKLGLIERLFDEFDRLRDEIQKHIVMALSDKKAMVIVSEWLEARIQWFQDVESELSQGLSAEGKAIYKAYRSSFWQMLVGPQITLNQLMAVPEERYPISRADKFEQIMKTTKMTYHTIHDARTFAVATSRNEVARDLYTSLTQDGLNIRWEGDKLIVEQPLDELPIYNSTGIHNMIVDLLKWPFRGDEYLLVSLQRVLGWQIDFKSMGDSIQITIDFGETLVS